ncbi:MAG: PspC domain-containing protein [Anaerolineales bacterium]|jgi:phage shock protein C
MENVRLYRSKSDRMIGGVCGGLGTFLNIDPIFIRLLFVLLLFGSDFGLILYILLWILIPEEGKAYGFREESFGDKVKSMGDDIQVAVTQPHPQAGLIMGVGLIVIGGLLFVDRLNLAWLDWFNMDVLWPALLIVGGIALLFRQRKE